MTSKSVTSLKCKVKRVKLRKLSEKKTSICSRMKCLQNIFNCIWVLVQETNYKKTYFRQWGHLNINCILEDIEEFLLILLDVKMEL